MFRDRSQLFETIAKAYYNDEQFTNLLYYITLSHIQEKNAELAHSIRTSIQLTSELVDAVYTELAEVLNIRMVIYDYSERSFPSIQRYGKHNNETYHIISGLRPLLNPHS